MLRLYRQFQILPSEVMESVVRDHAKETVVVVRVVVSQDHAVLFELAVVFPVERVRHLVFARLRARIEAKAPKQGAKTSRLVEKPPGRDPKIVLLYVPAVVKRATRPRIVKFQAMTGNDNERI